MAGLNGIEVFYWAALLLGLGYAGFGIATHGWGGFGGTESAADLGHELGHEVELDSSGGLPAEGHVSPFNSLTMASFSAALGALGLLGYKYLNLGAWPSFGFSFGGALVMAGAFFLAIVRPLYRSESTSSPDIRETLRSPAEVRTTIPVGGSGEVEYVAGGTRFTRPARADGDKMILEGTKVAILRIRGGVAYVVPLFEDDDDSE